MRIFLSIIQALQTWADMRLFVTVTTLTDCSISISAGMAITMATLPLMPLTVSQIVNI